MSIKKIDAIIKIHHIQIRKRKKESLYWNGNSLTIRNYRDPFGNRKNQNVG